MQLIDQLTNQLVGSFISPSWQVVHPSINKSVKLCSSVSQSISQLVRSQTVGHLLGWSDLLTNQLNDHWVVQSVSGLVGQSVSELVSQSVCLSFGQLVTGPVGQSVGHRSVLQIQTTDLYTHIHADFFGHNYISLPFITSRIPLIK